MITDAETNYLFLANCLPKKQNAFYNRFERVLNDCKINFGLLPNTKDIWAVDYMPIQLDVNKFVQFDYSPDYLKSKKWSKSITNVSNVWTCWTIVSDWTLWTSCASITSSTCIAC